MPKKRDVVEETIALEAEDQGLEGMRAVGEVIRNRARAGRYGKTPEEVVRRPKAFSAWNDLVLAESRLSKMSPKIKALAGQAWREAQTSNNTKLSDHYFAPDKKRPDPYWAKSMKKKASIGDHLFLREK